MKTTSAGNLRIIIGPAAAAILLIGSFAATAQTLATSPKSSASTQMPMEDMMSEDTNTARHDKMLSGSDIRQSIASMHEKNGGMKLTGDTDYDFASIMRMHLQEAIVMSEIELTNGKNPAMLAAAKKIIAARKKEIADFDHWLKDHPTKAVKQHQQSLVTRLFRRPNYSSAYWKHDAPSESMRGESYSRRLEGDDVCMPNCDVRRQVHAVSFVIEASATILLRQPLRSQRCNK